MIKISFPHKIIWLASYPKSGNTWFRAFISALMGGGEIEINQMKTDGIFSSRDLLERITDIDSRYLYEKELRLIQPAAFRQLAAECNRELVIKVHDAFTTNAEGQTIIPQDVTHCAVYLIRNPLDIVGSFANHSGTDNDSIIDLMNNPKGYLAWQRGNININTQTPQQMLDWSGHVKSWTTQPSFPVYVVRYEDMLNDSFAAFSNVIRKIGWTVSSEQINQAIKASSFEALRRQEKLKGFTEKNMKGGVFFRGGKSGDWRKELTEQQIRRITDAHYSIMKEYNYLPEELS